MSKHHGTSKTYRPANLPAAEATRLKEHQKEVLAEELKRRGYDVTDALADMLKVFHKGLLDDSKWTGEIKRDDRLGHESRMRLAARGIQLGMELQIRQPVAINDQDLRSVGDSDLKGLLMDLLREDGSFQLEVKAMLTQGTAEPKAIEVQETEPAG